MDDTIVDDTETSSLIDLTAEDTDATEASDAAELPATHRIADGSEVDAPEARQAWADAARPILEGVAGTYNATITDSELAEQVQLGSGIVTSQMPRYWIAKVLSLVTAGCGERDEPMLSALCVRHDGATGGGYGKAVAQARGEEPEDVEVHAAAERLGCYERNGATMPNGGGRPTLTPEVSARRDRARNARGEPAIPRTTCPTCNMQLPYTGRCDECE